MRTLLLIMLVAAPGVGNAYIGPGLGLGTVGVVLGVLMAIVLALLAVLWYPFKRLLKRFRATKSGQGGTGEKSDPL
jgi:hypothetical protein